SSVVPVSDAASAYALLEQGDSSQLLVALSYPGNVTLDDTVVHNAAFKASRSGKIRIAVVGAGGFAQGVHLPNLKTLSGVYQIQAVMSRNGHSAATAARQFGARYS